MAGLRLRLVMLVALWALPLAAWAQGDAVSSLAAALRAAEGERGAVEARRRALEGQNLVEGREIGRLKAEAPGIGHDLRLGQLLAATQERARELDRLAADLRARDARLDGQRRQLADACRRLLADRGLTESRRVEVTRLLAESVAATEARPSSLLGIVRPGAIDELAGPAELDERADRVKDDEDKLTREVERLDRRIGAVEERRRLREHAASLDDDLFVESGVGRRVQRPDTRSATSNSDSAFGGGRAAAAPASPSPSPGATASDASPTPATVLRGVLDPATLDELRRSEQGQDADLEMHALRRARAQLGALAGDLARHESALRRRAAELRRSR